MKTRLAIFSAALLLLPALALLLAGAEWPQTHIMTGTVVLPLLCSILLLLVFSLVLDTHTLRRSGSSLLRKQRGYLLWNAAAGAITMVLLAYLNLYAGSWINPVFSLGQMLMLAALFGAVLLPAVLITRLWLAGFGGVARGLSRWPALPAVAAEQGAALLLLFALIGLLGGAVWPSKLFWLMWLSPLLLLVALQLLWHESTVFSGLKQGDWSRVMLGGCAAMLAGGLSYAAYKLAGGALYLNVPPAFVPLALFAFGLLCVQLADVLAEHWRGKSLSQIYQQKKPFPIQIVTKKD